MAVGPVNATGQLEQYVTMVTPVRYSGLNAVFGLVGGVRDSAEKPRPKTAEDLQEDVWSLGPDFPEIDLSLLRPICGRLLRACRV